MHPEPAAGRPARGGSSSLRPSQSSESEGPLEELPFDQYQRYRLIADLCGSLRGDGAPLSILDVGGRTGILRRFLPGERVELVDVDPSDVEGLVLGEGQRLPFGDGAVDAVVAADTLEHVPTDRREAFVKECCRVARRWAVLAGPYQQERVERAEELLQGFLREKLGVRHRYLDEHRTLGLPDRAAVEGWCREAGAGSTFAIGHGNLDRWLTLLTLELYLDEEPALRPLARGLYRFYSSALYATDRGGLVYRHALVASIDGTPPPSPEELFGAGDLEGPAAESIGSVLAELAAFDRERDVFLAERERLEGEIGRRDEDLEGHRESLAKAEKDMEEHRESLAKAERDLEGHRESLATAERDLEGHRESLATAERDLRGHRESLATAEKDLRGHQGSLAQVQEDLEGHRATLAELREVREEERGRHEARERELSEYAAGLERELNGVHRLASDLHEQLLVATRWSRRFRRWKRRLLGR